MLSVQILDTAAHAIVGTIPLPAGTTIADWAITPDGGLLFGVGGRYLSIVDVASGTYSDRVDLTPSLSGASVVTGSTERLAIDPDGERLYALVFDTQYGIEVETIPLAASGRLAGAVLA